eukprot:gene17366-23671_t
MEEVSAAVEPLRASAAGKGSSKGESRPNQDPADTESVKGLDIYGIDLRMTRADGIDLAMEEVVGRSNWDASAAYKGSCKARAALKGAPSAAGLAPPVEGASAAAGTKQYSMH